MDRFWDSVPAAGVVLAFGACWAVPFAAWLALDRLGLMPAVAAQVLFVLWFVTGFPAWCVCGILTLANWGKGGDGFPARWLAYTGVLLGASGPIHVALTLFGVV